MREFKTPKVRLSESAEKIIKMACSGKFVYLFSAFYLFRQNCALVSHTALRKKVDETLFTTLYRCDEKTVHAIQMAMLHKLIYSSTEQHSIHSLANRLSTHEAKNKKQYAKIAKWLKELDPYSAVRMTQWSKVWYELEALEDNFVKDLLLIAWDCKKNKDFHKAASQLLPNVFRSIKEHKASKQVFCRETGEAIIKVCNRIGGINDV